MNFTVFSTFQVDYSVSWRPNGKYIQLDQSCLVVWGKSMSQKLSFLLGKKRLKNVFHWLMWSYVTSHTLVESYIHISARNILVGLWAWNNSTIYGSHLVFLRQVFMIISQVLWKKRCLQLPLTCLEASSPLRDLTQLHPHLSNPNEWHLHLSTLQSTSVHPAWGIQEVHPNYAFFVCLLCLSTPKEQ